MILVVNLDLHGAATAYDPLYEALKKQGGWWHYMRWTWLLDTQHTPDEIVEALKPFLVMTDDRMLVLPLTRPYQGLLKEGEWKWIRDHLGPKKTSGPL